MGMKRVEQRRQLFKALEAKSLRSRPFATKFADSLTSTTGTPNFLFINAVVFLVWIWVNIGMVSQVPVFDPFPFGLLTMIVSLEAIFLSIFVLISQNRSAHTDKIREEVHLRVNLIAEEEITKILEVLADIRKKVGITRPDPGLEKMLENIDTNYIETSIIAQLERADRPLFEQMKKDFPDLIKNTLNKEITLPKIPISNGNSKNTS